MPIIDILNQYGKLGVEAIQEDVAPLSATGKTKRSVHHTVEQKKEIYTLRILARKFFSAIETGRGPRKSVEYGGFDKGLEEYLNARGLETKVSKNGVKYWKIGNSWVSAKSLAHKINKEGDKTFRMGGRVVYSPTIAKLVQEIKGAVAKDFIHASITRIKNGFSSQPS
jgi:hypothetical protein